jgi:hypothetical protein
MNEVVLLDKENVVLAAATGPLDNAASVIADEVQDLLLEGATDLTIRVVA